MGTHSITFSGMNCFSNANSSLLPNKNTKITVPSFMRRSSKIYLSSAPKKWDPSNRFSLLPLVACGPRNSSRRLHASASKNDEQTLENADAANTNLKTSPILTNPNLTTRGERYREEYLRRIIPWEDIDDSLDSFPYYINKHDKDLLVEVVASRLKHNREHGDHLATTSGRILLQTLPGAELCREKLVKSLARDLKVPLMLLDSSVVPPYDVCHADQESDKEENDDDYYSDSDPEDYLRSSLYSRSDDDDDDNDEHSEDSDDQDDTQIPTRTGTPPPPVVPQFKQGDRVKYVGEEGKPSKDSVLKLLHNSRGEVHEVNGDKAAVVFYKSGLGTKDIEKSPEPLVQWLDINQIVHEEDAHSHDCFVALEVLCKVLESRQPVIVYFPDSFGWLSRYASWGTRCEFSSKVKEMFDKLSGRLVLICGQNKWESGSKDKNWRQVQRQMLYEETEMRKIFSNVLRIQTPKDEDLLKTYTKQIEEDKPTVISRNNLSKMHMVLKEHGLICTDLERVNTDGLVLNTRKAEKIVGWATNHYLSSCQLPSMVGNRMNVPQASLELAITRLKESKPPKSLTKKSLKKLAKGHHEKRFVSAVIGPGETGVKFEDVGALEDVKKALNELAILPLKRPEIFSRGNLLRPCKGMLLFGPPGTGKTLIAKALATEAGANFIYITTASLMSMWFGEAEQYTKALFSFARKLTPVVIFLDEIDAFLGARGGEYESEHTRSMRNEFMASWDGLKSKDNERILVLGATNRPGDIDDAVIRRMPRRIYVGLPDLENRSKILKIHLAKEELEPGFDIEQLAKATEGYSGSDLMNLCAAAAYKPVQDFLKEEEETNQEKTKGASDDEAPALRPLRLDDFIQSKAQVAPSVAYNADSLIELRKWNERYGEGGSSEKSPSGFEIKVE